MWIHWDSETNRIQTKKGERMQVRVQLANPVLIFIWSLSMLLIGCAIGMHWSGARGTAIWIAVCGALLMVIHDFAEGLIWIGIAAAWIQKTQKGRRARPIGAGPAFSHREVDWFASISRGESSRRLSPESVPRGERPACSSRSLRRR
jgi:hypothetical protein